MEEWEEAYYRWLQANRYIDTLETRGGYKGCWSEDAPVIIYLRREITRVDRCHSEAIKKLKYARSDELIQKLRKKIRTLHVKLREK